MGVGFYLPIAKVDKAKRMVWGYASTPTRDLDGEVIELDAIKDALPGYMEWANVREMHQPSAVGTAKEASVDDKGLYLGAKIIDDDAWKKVVEEVYKGFSIGGNVTDRKGSTITGLELIEISLVDRPANPDCKIEVIKAATPVPVHVVGDLEPAHEERLDREEIGLFGRLLAKLVGIPVTKSGKEPYGDVDYADPGYQSDKKKRYPLDSEKHIRAAWSYIHQKKNADKYSAEQVEHIKSKIVSAWKAKIDPAGPAEADKSAHGDDTGDDPFSSNLVDDQGLMPAAPDGLSRPAKNARPEIEKTMRPAIMLAQAFEDIRCAQRALLHEEGTEGDGHDRTMAEAVGRIASDLAEVISQKAKHEGGEAVTLTDAADIWSGVTERMSEGNLGKRAPSGAHAGHLGKAMFHLGEAHKCLCAGMECCAKAASGAEEKAADGTIIKAEGQMSRAMTYFDRAYEHHVSANHHMTAAGGHKGEAGEQPGDAEAGIYTPESGLTPLSQSHLTEGNVPNYDPTRPYPGKGAEGTLTKREADALVEAAFLRGKVEALEKLPASAKARLFAVPRGSLPVGEADEPSTMEKLLKGVNIDAVEPSQRQAAGARLIANMIGNAETFARPVIGDPTFRGGAGARRPAR